MKNIFLALLILLITINCYSQEKKFIIKFDRIKALKSLNILNQEYDFKVRILDSMIHSIGQLDLSKINLLDSLLINEKIITYYFNENTKKSPYKETLEYKNEQDVKNLLYLRYKLQNILLFNKSDTAKFRYYTILYKSSIRNNQFDFWSHEFCYIVSDTFGINIDTSNNDSLYSIKDIILENRYDDFLSLYSTHKYGSYSFFYDDKFIYFEFRETI